jgi:hypothetical protein
MVSFFFLFDWDLIGDGSESEGQGATGDGMGPRVQENLQGLAMVMGKHGHARSPTGFDAL